MCGVWEGISGVVEAASAVIEWQEISNSKKEARYKAESLVKEAQIAEEQAGVERQEGIEEARQKRLQAILNMGEVKTATAAGNIAISSQSTLNLLDTEKLNGELDALSTISEANKASDSYLQKADKLYSQAQLQFAEANNKLEYFKLAAKTTDKFSKNMKKWEKEFEEKQKSNNKII